MGLRCCVPRRSPSLRNAVTKVAVTLDLPSEGKPEERATRSLSDWALGTTQGQWTVLLLIGAFLIAAGTVSYYLTPGTQSLPSDSWSASLWASYTLWADVGTQTGFLASDPGVCLLVAVIFSFCGFVYNLALLGLVVDMIRGQLAHWKWAKSRISARDHILVLGWGDKTLFLLDELVAADQNTQVQSTRYRGLKRRIVILAEHSVHDMAQDVKTYFTSRFKSSSKRLAYKGIEYRRGDPTDQAELLKVSAPLASDILIMTHGQGEFMGSDQRVLQTLLALAALDLEMTIRGDVFAEMQNHDSLEVMNDVFPKAEGIIARQAVNRIMILRALVSSVGFSYLEMVSFKKGSELYLRDVPVALVGRAFHDAARMFKDAVIIGVKQQEVEAERSQKQDPKGQKCETLVPQASRCFVKGDKIIMLASERSALGLDMKDLGLHRAADAGSPAITRSSFDNGNLCRPEVRMPDGQLRLGPSAAGPKVILLIGCPVDFPDFLEMLDCYLEQGSEVHVLSERSLESRQEYLRRAWGSSDVTSDLQRFLKRVSVTHHFGPPTTRWALRQLPLAQADCAIILAESLSRLDNADASDSRSLTTVITLRSMMPKEKGRKKCKVVTELIHPKSQLVVQGNGTVRRHGSFVYSTLLETGVFALASEDKTLYETLMYILSPDNDAGHIAIARTRDFVNNEEVLSFYDLHDRVLQRSGCILMGWRRQQEQYPQLNPQQKALPLNWNISSDDDLIIFCPADGHRHSKPTLSLRPVSPVVEEVPLQAPAAAARDHPVLPGTLPQSESESEPFLMGLVSEGHLTPPMSPSMPSMS